eukprot:1295889-Pleurochrysis_carterae.AAC.1
MLNRLGCWCQLVLAFFGQSMNKKNMLITYHLMVFGKLCTVTIEPRIQLPQFSSQRCYMCRL